MNDNLVINGGVYYVKDNVISLPPNDQREYHEQRRPVVILSGPDTNSDKDWRVVLVAPISSSTSLKTSYCVKVNAGEANMSKKCWVRVVAVQPILKSDLGDRLGVLPSERLEEVQARIFQYMGLYPEDDSALAL
ncbi:type II toxin-antitoxin system PemK/MazF family toxin [Natronosporangium hydrolyticum]|uniref:Type II toxin-antitoxin system PemK/MazF family toxin n=1 Tax=Natronosporangium hydrolyticum TaxID=2811111 RepID=A0A895YEX1_9ACTN|nr:type II toxin-antitoxin system PemK/MazF family toxin [Natronosporangium hydrolyticum]QSB13959.1 type II toxin-antitoxin system PemK/MazF family toxin [Natronosporangium hydrolyticum]